MEILGRIKRLYFRDKKSLHDIARLTGLSRNTIRRWVREPQAQEALKYVRQDMPGKLDAYHAQIEQALKADSHRYRSKTGVQPKPCLYKSRRAATPEATASSPHLCGNGVTRRARL